MRFLNALVLLSLAAVSTACSRQTIPSFLDTGNALPASHRLQSLVKEQILHRFRGGKDGAGEGARLISVGDELYGATASGGTFSPCYYSSSYGGCGTIFKIGAGGAGYRVLYRFKGGTDGAGPTGSLANANGALYGTTVNGGGSPCSVLSALVGCGTVFQIDPSGRGYRVLYKFKGGDDAAFPAGFLYDGGMLYGTSNSGGGRGGCGAGGCGTVFELNPLGKGYRVLYAFKGGSDGANPEFGLIDVNGTLYGTTGGGGSGCGDGCGTVFRLTPAGKESIVYSFRGGKDGASPNGLVYASGAIYGTTYYGGGAGCGGGGCGTFYRLSVAGAEKVLHRFNGTSDGANPNALVNSGGSFYGTAPFGGKANDGTVFEINPAGVESVLYNFSGGTDGAQPDNAPASVNGSLYGTTYEGGSTGCKTKYTLGCGVVFKVTP